MEKVKYQVAPREMVGDEFLQVEGLHLPRIGETLYLDHPEHNGPHRVVDIDYSVNLTSESADRSRENPKDSNLVYQASAPDVHVERVRD